MIEDIISNERDWGVETGDCRDLLKKIPSESVQCVVTSPPYWGLRDYGVGGQVGSEPTVREYVETMVGIFAEVHRVLRKDGTVWLNMGDTWFGSGGAGGDYAEGGIRENQPHWKQGGLRPPRSSQAPRTKRTTEGFKLKDKMMIPERLAIALWDWGWWMRSDIIWAKPNPYPQSVKDRPSPAHEHIYLLTKSDHYYYDADGIRTPLARPYDESNGTFGPNDWDSYLEQSTPSGGTPKPARSNPYGANKRDVWTIATQKFGGEHYATFPEKLVEPCIIAGSPPSVCSECGTPLERALIVQPEGTLMADVESSTYWEPGCPCGDNDPGHPTRPAVILDPFNGVGTTGLVAHRLERNYYGIEDTPSGSLDCRTLIIGLPTLAAFSGGSAKYY